MSWETTTRLEQGSRQQISHPDQPRPRSSSGWARQLCCRQADNSAVWQADRDHAKRPRRGTVLLTAQAQSIFQSIKRTLGQPWCQRTLQVFWPSSQPQRRNCCRVRFYQFHWQHPQRDFLICPRLKKSTFHSASALVCRGNVINSIRGYTNGAEWDGNRKGPMMQKAHLTGENHFRSLAEDLPSEWTHFTWQGMKGDTAANKGPLPEGKGKAIVTSKEFWQGFVVSQGGKATWRRTCGYSTAPGELYMYLPDPSTVNGRLPEWRRRQETSMMVMSSGRWHQSKVTSFTKMSQHPLTHRSVSTHSDTSKWFTNSKKGKKRGRNLSLDLST